MPLLVIDPWDAERIETERFRRRALRAEDRAKARFFRSWGPRVDSWEVSTASFGILLICS